MDEQLNIVQKTQVALEHYPKMLKSLEVFRKVFEDHALYLGYIVFILTFTLFFIFLKFVFRKLVSDRKYRLPDTFNAKLWTKIHLAEEDLSLSYLEHLFENEGKESSRRLFIPSGTALLAKILSGIHQGYDNQRILKEMMPHMSQMDVLPLIDAIRSFRDLCARKILSEKVKNKRDYAKALRNLSDGKPEKAIQLLRKELIFQEKALFNLKNKLLQQYAKKEAASMALYIGLIAGVYDTHLAEKAYRRSIELLPTSHENLILYGRFRQCAYGEKDPLSHKAFIALGKEINTHLQEYMKNYAKEMVKRAHFRAQQEEIKARIVDEKERYNEMLRIERLKMHEAIRLAQVKSLAEEVRTRI